MEFDKIDRYGVSFEEEKMRYTITFQCTYEKDERDKLFSKQIKNVLEKEIKNRLEEKISYLFIKRNYIKYNFLNIRKRNIDINVDGLDNDFSFSISGILIFEYEQVVGSKKRRYIFEKRSQKFFQKIQRYIKNIIFRILRQIVNDVSIKKDLIDRILMDIVYKTNEMQKIMETMDEIIKDVKELKYNMNCILHGSDSGRIVKEDAKDKDDKDKKESVIYDYDKNKDGDDDNTG